MYVSRVTFASVMKWRLAQGLVVAEKGAVSKTGAFDRSTKLAEPSFRLPCKLIDNIRQCYKFSIETAVTIAYGMSSYSSIGDAVDTITHHSPSIACRDR